MFQRREEGWAQRKDVHSIVFHYFINGTSICPRRWNDSQTPLQPSVTDGKCCPYCVLRRVHDDD